MFFSQIIDNDDEIQHDGNVNTTQQPSTSNLGTTKQNFANFTNTDLNGKYNRSYIFFL